MPTTEKQRPVLPRIRIEAVQEAPPVYLDPVRQSGTIWAFFRHEFARLDRERFVSLALDGKNRVVAVEDVSTGSLTASLVHPREVMKVLILANAAAFICCHNHASGDPTPSAEDREVTQRLHDVGELMGIRLLDPSCSAPRATTRSLTTATCSAVYPGAGSIGSSHAVPAVASGDSDRRHSEDSPPPHHTRHHHQHHRTASPRPFDGRPPAVAARRVPRARFPVRADRKPKVRLGGLCWLSPPPRAYGATHPRRQLSEDEVRRVLRWIRQARAAYHGAAPAGTPHP